MKKVKTEAQLLWLRGIKPIDLSLKIQRIIRAFTRVQIVTLCELVGPLLSAILGAQSMNKASLRFKCHALRGFYGPPFKLLVLSDFLMKIESN